jgi:hypothetical protein
MNEGDGILTSTYASPPALVDEALSLRGEAAFEIGATGQLAVTDPYDALLVLLLRA